MERLVQTEAWATKDPQDPLVCQEPLDKMACLEPLVRRDPSAAKASVETVE